jgi:hypothetical protein
LTRRCPSPILRPDADYQCNASKEMNRLIVPIQRKIGTAIIRKGNMKSPNRAAGGITPPAPTQPGMRVRTGRFTEVTEP